MSIGHKKGTAFATLRDDRSEEFYPHKFPSLTICESLPSRKYFHLPNLVKVVVQGIILICKTVLSRKFLSYRSISYTLSI